MSHHDTSYRIAGGRTGVLLFHGLSGTPAELRFVANGLARQGFTVHCPQLAGHGGSEADLIATSWRDWYASAERALAEISAECDTVVVGGLSTGAVLALMLAANKPAAVHAVTLYSPTLWLSGRQVPWYVPLFRLVRSKMIANLFRFPVPSHVGIKDRRVRDFIRNAAGDQVAPATPGGVVLERRRLVERLMGRLAGIRQPALIVHAREDDYAGLDNAAYLQRELAGPVEFTVLEDSYHMVTVDRQRHVVLERTAGFVAAIAARAAKGLVPAARDVALAA